MENTKQKKKNNKKNNNTHNINISKPNSIFSKGKPDVVIIILVSIIAIMGLITLLSASSSKSLSEYGNSYRYFTQQLKFTFIGIIICTFIAMLDYRIFNNKFFRICALLALIALPLLVNQFGIVVNGAKRWIEIGGMTIQPSEFMKVLVIILMASYYDTIYKKGETKSIWMGIVVPFILILIPAFLIFRLQNHLSAAIVIVGIGYIMMGLAGVNYWAYGLTFFGLITSIILIFTGNFPEIGGFRSERINVFLNGTSDLRGTGWQIRQSLYAIGSGGLFGVGIGNSIQKRSYLPEPQNDFIFAVFVEELGYIGGMFLIFLFLFLIVKGWMNANKSKDTFGRLIAIGVVSYFVIQVGINISVAIQLFPTTGMSLPFFSSGGSALITAYIMIGLLLSVSRITNHTNEELEKLNQKEELEN